MPRPSTATKSQAAQNQGPGRLQEQQVRVLVATDIAARGLDIAQLPQVVNFDLPNVPRTTCTALVAPAGPGRPARPIRW